MAHKSLLIVDGYSLLFRAFFATRYMSTADGRPTNALFGFTSMIYLLIEKEKPDCILVALDHHSPTFRHDEYEGYKGTRREIPAELLQQLIESRRLIAALGIPMIEVPGFEADDVVGTISLQAEKQGYNTFIVSGDMDASQLVDDCVTLITPKQGVSEVNVYNPAAVVARYGFGPEFIPDYKALVGDTSDNIPGVPGIGDKSAAILIQKWGPVENIIAHLDEVDEKFRKKLIPGLDQIPISKRLATIVRNVPLEFDFKPYSITAEQIAAGQEVMTSLEFKSHAKKLPQVLGVYAGDLGSIEQVHITDSVIDPKVGAPLESLEEAERWIEANPFAVYFAPGAAAVNLLDESSPPTAFAAVGTTVRPLDSDIARRLALKHPTQAILHDSKPHYHGSGQHTAPMMDTMLASYVLQSGRTNYGLREVIQGYLDVKSPETPEQLALGMLQAEPVLRERIEKEGQSQVLYGIELPLVPILAEMEDAGIKVSSDFLLDFSKTLQVQITQTTQMIHELAGGEFLIASPKQLGEVLFERLGIEGGKRTKTGWGTGAEVLQEIDHPIVQEIMAFRELSKLKSTYADSLPKMIKDDGRIHTNYNQTVAATGRLSSIDPNLQNIPIRTELGRQIRKAFTAAEGSTLASFDYSQIELRLLAHLCHDDALVDAFSKRVDVHTVTASLTFGIDQADVSKEQRRLAKMLNYAVLYGVTDFGLAQQLGEGFSRTAAKELIAQYFARFPKVKAFTESIVEEARGKGFTTTLWGRRRYFPEIHAANRMERLYAERQAMNAPIQGAAADLIKLAMIDVHKKLNGAKTKMLLQVHDELLFELDDTEGALIEPIRESMENAMPISVPIEVDAKMGENWSEMKVREKLNYSESPPYPDLSGRGGLGGGSEAIRSDPNLPLVKCGAIDEGD